MMLYEFAITPDTFDELNYKNHRPNEVSVVQILRGIIENGLIADLHKGKWSSEAIEAKLSKLPPALRDQIRVCLTTLHDRNRLVRHPKHHTSPVQDEDWLELLLNSDNVIKFQGVILGDDLFLQNSFPDDRFTNLADSLNSPFWLARRRTLDLERTEKAFREVFEGVLRHAKTLDIVDQYINPVDEKWTKTVKLFSSLMGKRCGERLSGRIRIHTNEDQISNAGTPEARNPKFHLNNWKTLLEPLAQTDKHKFEVIYWRVKTGGEPFHDRHIITNQCGISVPNGLDLPNRVNPGTTDISLLDEDVRVKRLNKFSVSTSVYETRNEWQIKIE